MTKGKAKGLRAAVLDLRKLLGIALTPSQHELLGAMGVDELEALRQQLKRTRGWPA